MKKSFDIQRVGLDFVNHSRLFLVDKNTGSYLIIFNKTKQSVPLYCHCIFYRERVLVGCRTDCKSNCGTYRIVRKPQRLMFGNGQQYVSKLGDHWLFLLCMTKGLCSAFALGQLQAGNIVRTQVVEWCVEDGMWTYTFVYHIGEFLLVLICEHK